MNFLMEQVKTHSITCSLILFKRDMIPKLVQMFDCESHVIDAKIVETF